MTTKISLKAAIALGALMTYLAPKIAQDARVDLLPALDGVDGKNFDEKKEAIAAGVRAAVEGKLAQDASIEDLGALLDAVGGHGKGEAEDDEEGQAAGGTAAACEFLKSKLSPEDYAQVEKLLGAAPAAEDGGGPNPKTPGTPSPGGAMDEAPEAKAAREKAAADAKVAQDAAIETAKKLAVDEAVAAERRRARERDDAVKAIRPYVGEIALDSAETAPDVYRAAFKVLGVEVKDVHESAFPALLKAQKPATIAADGAHTAPEVQTYTERFPQAARLGA